MSKHTHCRWQLDKGSWISNDVKDENRSVWVLESDYLNMKESLEAENARLKSECQARQAENSVLAVECDSLKAEVERLTKMCQATSPDGFIHIRDIKHLHAAKGVQS